ncbi:MAG: asparagine synthase (glutamine-hydrolyzing) [Gemmatimonadaceae bacterium]
MCGFAGMVRTDGGPAERAVIERMSDVIQHRGPDDSGIYLSGPVGFSFRRLSILDLTPTGHQPMISDDGQLALVFNGEIYNYIELRRELESLGHRFRSTGDTEVLLTAYRQWGRACLPKLNGMWAFLIYDARRGVVFGSRDRFGVKPLYRHSGKGFVLLASEIKAIRASGRYRSAVNWRLASRFLCSEKSLDLIDAGDETFFEGVVQVPAGSAFELHLDGRLVEWPFWSLGDVPRAPIDDPAAALLDVFQDAVRLRMRSDVPVGVSLSGGLDSTSIISVMARQRTALPGVSPGASLQAFSYIASEFDETPYITQTLRQTGAEFYQAHVDPLRLWDGLDTILWFQDEPVHSWNALIGFEIFRIAAANGVKVVMSGGGADESLAGYPEYFRHYWHTLLSTGRVAMAWREIVDYARLNNGEPLALMMRALWGAARSGTFSVPWLKRWRHTRHEQQIRQHPWYSPQVTEQATLSRALYLDDRLDTQLRKSVERAPLPFYLRLDDRNSMAHSVEARSPFLDYRLVTLAFQLPAEWKMRGAWNKYVLREAMREQIPEVVRSRRDKMGFPTPAQKWFAGALYEPMQDVLASEAVRTRGLYNVAAIRRDIERHKNGELNAASALFKVAQFERWLAAWQESPPPPAVVPTLASA